MKVTVDIGGLDGAIKQLTIWEQAKTKKVVDVINASAINIQNGAKRRCPVDNGHLRASIAMEPTNNGLTIDVGSKLKYAPFVEFGTGKFVSIPAAAGFSASGRSTPWFYPETVKGVKTGRMIFTHGSKPQPFLFPAAEEERPRLVSSMKGALASD